MAVGRQAGDDALASALELGGTGVHHREALAQQLLAPRAEDLQHALVAVHDLALRRQHEADRREQEGTAVVQGDGFHLGDLA